MSKKNLLGSSSFYGLFLVLGCRSTEPLEIVNLPFENPPITIRHEIPAGSYLAPFLRFQHSGQRKNFFTFQRWNDKSLDGKIDDALNELEGIGNAIKRGDMLNIFYYYVPQSSYSYHFLMPSSDLGKEEILEMRLIDSEGRRVYKEKRRTKIGSPELFSVDTNNIGSPLGVYTAECFIENQNSKERVKLRIVKSQSLYIDFGGISPPYIISQ